MSEADKNTALNDNPSVIPEIDPIHQKLGEMFVEIAANGALTSELAEIYILDLAKIKGQGRDQAILQIVDAFEGDEDTYYRLMHLVKYHCNDDRQGLMEKIFYRAKPIIARQGKAETRMGLLEDFGGQYGLSASNRLTAYNMALEEIEVIKSPEDKFKAALSLYSTVHCNSSFMDVDTKSELLEKVVNKVFEVASAQEAPEAAVAAYQKIYGHHQMDNESKQRALMTVDSLVDQVENPQENYAVLTWVKSQAQRGTEFRNGVLDRVEGAIKKLPTPDERITAAQSTYGSLFNGYWDHMGPEDKNEHVFALMNASLDIISKDSTKAENPKAQMNAIDGLYDRVKYNHKDRAPSVIRKAISLIDKQPTSSERQALTKHLLEKCRPDHDPHARYTTPGTLKHAATEKLKSIQGEISQRREKVPAVAPQEFARLVSGFLPPSPS